MQVNTGSESRLLAKHTLIYGLGNLLNRIVSLMLLPVYTRFLTPHDYGIKELIGLTTEVIGILLAAAISSAVYRFYFEYENEQDRREVISSAILVVGGVGFLALIGLLSISRQLAGLILDSPELASFFMIAFCSMWFQSVIGIGYNYLRAKQRSLQYVCLSFANLLMAISLNVYFICFLKIGVIGVLLSTLITSIAITSILIIPLLFRVGITFSRVKITEMVKYGLPLVPAQLANFVVQLSDRFFIKSYGSIADAGLYSLGYRFGALPANFISAPFMQTWMPRRFELCKLEGAEKMFGKIFTYFLILMFWACLAVSLMTKEALEIIADPKFWEASKVVPIIAVATTIFTFQNHFNIGILIEKKTKQIAYINISTAVIVLVLNFLLIPQYGVWGAAVSTLLSFTYRAIVSYWVGRKYFAIHFEFARIIHLLIVSVMLFVFAYFIYFENIWLRVMFKSVLIVCYPIVLLVTGFFNEGERMIMKSELKKRGLFLGKHAKS